MYYIQPMFSNLPLKEKDYLGRDLRTPAGWFQRDWPTGWPGVYNGAVHDQLLKVGMLQPPTPLMTGRMDGVPMGADLEKEYNGYVGSAVSERGILHDPRFAGKLNWQGKSVVFTNGREREQKAVVPMGQFMNSLTQGATLHEALNNLFESSTWKSWQADPRFTLTPSRDAEALRPELMKRPGAKVIRLLHEYYGDLAADQVELSASQPAADWRALRQAKLEQQGTPQELRSTAKDLRETLQGVR
jgi:hypothetical protein